MATALESNALSPVMQEAYQLLGQLSEKNLTDVINFIKQLISNDEETDEGYKADFSRKRCPCYCAE